MIHLHWRLFLRISLLLLLLRSHCPRRRHCLLAVGRSSDASDADEDACWLEEQSAVLLMLVVL